MEGSAIELETMQDAAGLGMSWNEFEVSYLPQCTSEFFVFQGWNQTMVLSHVQAALLDTFQQEVFQLVNNELCSSV